MLESNSEQSGYFIAGVDEVGRGPLAGPVVAAAVILPLNYELEGLTDSKKLSEKRREILSDKIKNQAIAWSIAISDVDEIDSINILQASLIAMKRAVESLDITPNMVKVDGNQKPNVNCKVETIIKGDLTEPEISAASIIAKVFRDNEMCQFDSVYPEYGFAKHKGYPTKQHIEALKEYGVCDIHRRSFSPVRSIMEG